MMKDNKREMVRVRADEDLNPAASRSSQTITTVPAGKILVIETVSINIRIPHATPMPDISKVTLITGSASGDGSPLIDMPVTRMAVDPAGNSVNYTALASMRAYAADGAVQCSVDVDIPTDGTFKVSLFGYLLSADSPSLAP